jgi:hypothetical protein
LVTCNAQGEVADFLDVSQFIPGRSAYECVAYSASLIFYCGAPGHGPTGSTLQATALAQRWYGIEEGSTDSSNTNGMSLDAEYNMLQGMGLHYQALSPDVSAVKAALQEGVPVMLCGAETGMYDLGLGNVVPYAWTPSGNHCVVASGIASDGNLLVHDCANISPSGVRPGPRTYDAGKLQIVSATAVIPPWKGGSMVPQGWADDGHTLKSPNGVSIVLGFRDFVLSNNWHPDNWAIAPEAGVQLLEASNPSLGGGTQQVFRYSMLGYQASRGAFAEWLGVELNTTRQQLKTYYDEYKAAQAQIATLQPELGKLKQEVADLQAQVQTTQQPAGVDARKVADYQSQVALLGKQIEQLVQQLQQGTAQPIS